MPRQHKAKRARHVPLIFEKRITVRLDEDVRAMVNECARRVDWASQAHAINASLRRALQPFAPPTLLVRIDPFEQVVFSKKVRRK